jgi:sugar lactone lactonase YvrE
MLTRVGGVPVQGFSGDGGPAFAAEFSNVSGLATDNSGNLYVADGSQVRKITPEGLIVTVAEVGFTVLAVDSDGNLYGATANGGVVRRVAIDGIITTVAGNGAINYSGDNGPATEAQLGYIGGLAVDGAGNLYISDDLILGDDAPFVASARIRKNFRDASGRHRVD